MVELPIDLGNGRGRDSVIESPPISEEGFGDYHFSSCRVNESVIGLRISRAGESIAQVDDGSPVICFEDWVALARFSAMLLRNISLVPGGEEALSDLLLEKYQEPNRWIPGQCRQRVETDPSPEDVRQGYIDELPENDVSLMTSHSELFASLGEIKYQLDDTVLLTFPRNKYEVPILSLREAVMMAIQVLSDERTLDYDHDFYCPFLYGPEMRVKLAQHQIAELENQHREEDNASEHGTDDHELMGPRQLANAPLVALQDQDAWEADIFKLLRDECLKPMTRGE